MEDAVPLDTDSKLIIKEISSFLVEGTKGNIIFQESAFLQENSFLDELKFLKGTSGSVT